MHRLSDLYKKFYHSFQNGRGVFCECLTLSNFWATELTWIIFLDAAAVVSNHTASSGGLTYFCAHRFVSPLAQCQNLRIFLALNFYMNSISVIQDFQNLPCKQFYSLLRVLKLIWQKIIMVGIFFWNSTLCLLYTCVLLSILFDITPTPPANCFKTSWNHKSLVSTDIKLQNHNLKVLTNFCVA